MAWIDLTAPEQATGLLKQLYDAAMRRVGRVYNIIRLQSRRPKVLRASTQLYMEVMFAADSPLSRAQREMIATVVSRVNECFY